VIVVAALAASPAAVQQRLLSVVRPHGTKDSNQHRIICWRTGLAMIRTHPVLGIGPERVGKEFLTYLPPDIPLPLPDGYYGHVHNVYLQYAAERGIPGLVAILWLFGKMVVDWVRGLRAGRDKFLLHSGVAAVIGTAIGGVTEYNLGNSEILHLLLAVAACAYVGLSLEAPLDAGPSRPS
jgi:O-antigen ligase